MDGWGKSEDKQLLLEYLVNVASRTRNDWSQYSKSVDITIPSPSSEEAMGSFLAIFPSNQKPKPIGFVFGASNPRTRG
jgi:hypothetical protein